MTIGQEQISEEDLAPIEVKATVADAGTWAKRISITVPVQEIDKSFDKAVGEIAGQVRLPGFRPGKVPRGYAEKLFKNDIAKQVTQKVLGRAIHTAVTNEKLAVVGSPELANREVTAERGKELSFDVEVEIKPTFEVCTYKGLGVEQEEIEVAAAEVDEQIQQAALRFAEESDAPEGSALAERDVACGVVRFLVEGQEVSKEEDGMLLLHQGHVIGAHAHLGLGFLEGAKVGEKRTVEETLNDTFPKEEFRGKKATIEFELKKIRRPKLPEPNDELAQKLGAKDLADLKQKLTDRLRAAQTEAVQSKLRKDLLDKLIAGSPFELPKRLLESFDQRMLMDQQMNLLRMGIPAEQLGEFDFKKHNEGQAERQIREYFILDAICAKENLDVADEDVDDEVVKLARQRGMRAAELFAQLEQEGAIDQIRQGLRAKKAVDFLIDNAEVKVVARKPAAKAADCGHDHGHSHGHSHGDAGHSH